MKQAEFKKLLEGNKVGGTEEALKTNIDNILKQFTEASEQDREGLFDLIFYSARYDVMEALVDKKALNEAELFNIALRCKGDALLMIGGDTESIQNKIYQAALDQLDEKRIPEFYSALVNKLFIDRTKQVQLPSTETLQALYEGLFVGRHDEALRKLHNFLGYYRGHDGQNSPELIAVVMAENEKEALKLIGQGHYVYDFSGFYIFHGGYKNLLEFFFLNSLHHPNYNILAKDSDYNTPLHYAVLHGYTDSVKAILATAKDNHELLEKALASSNDIGNTPLHWAGLHGRTDSIKAILATVKDNYELLEKALAPNNHGKTPLDLAKNDEIKQMIKNAIAAQQEQARLLAATTPLTNQTATSSTAIPATPPAAQVNSAAAQLPQRPNLGNQR